MYVGQLLDAGLAKESVVGTLVTPPTEFLPIYPGDSFFPTIGLLESTGIRALPDVVAAVSQGPGDIKSGKVKWEAEPENIGNLLMAAFGTDTKVEVAQYTITLSTNDKIDFKESGGSQLHATIAAGTYKAGTTDADVGSLCEAIKTAMDAAGATYGVTFSYSTKKFTITPTAGTLQILWATGTNTATNAHTILGWTTNADTTDAAAQTSSGTTLTPVFTHTFTRLANAQLPTYSWWFNKGAKYPQFTGCMLNKLDFINKAGDFLMAESDWTAQGYDDTGSSKTPSYSALKPFKFNQLAVGIDGSPDLNYDDIKLSIDNLVQADHVLNNSIYPGKIYSKGFRVTVSLNFVVENSTQYDKYLAGTSTALTLTWTSADDISGAKTGTKYSLALALPTMNYSVASYPIAPGLIKIAFTATGVYTPGSTKTLSAALVNSVSAAY